MALANTPDVALPACHACAALGLSLFAACAELPAVASDCRPWPSSYRLARCAQCGLIQKCIDAHWRSETQRIYSSYSLYHQAADASEQLIFDQSSGRGRPRSELMFDALQQYLARTQQAPLGKHGRLLDLGCGTGPTLRACSKLMPSWQLYGFDPHLPEREAVLKIPGVQAVYDGKLADVSGTFDLVSAVHVLEHVTAPLEFLRNLRRLLGPTSLALVQVPHFPDTPFDLTVFDHCSHFSERSLSALFRAADLQVELSSTRLLPKEISVVARVAASPSPLNCVSDESSQASAAEAALSDAAAINASLSWLAALRDQALTQPEQPLGAFGTSIGGNWLLGLLGAKLGFFVDEDPQRANTEYRGRPVFAPHAVPRGSRVLMPLPPAIASKIRERLKPEHFELVLPPSG